jgi:hypothetical protein
MPIRLLIDHSENRHIAIDAAILVDAFEGTLSELGLTDRTDPARRLAVANHVITFAKAGERDPVRLRALTVEAVRIEQRRASVARSATATPVSIPACP